MKTVIRTTLAVISVLSLILSVSCKPSETLPSDLESIDSDLESSLDSDSTILSSEENSMQSQKSDPVQSSEDKQSSEAKQSTVNSSMSVSQSKSEAPTKPAPKPTDRPSSSVSSSASKSSSSSKASSSSKSSSSASESSPEDEFTLPLPGARWTQKKFYLSTFNGMAQKKSKEIYLKSALAHKEAGFTIMENSILAQEQMFDALAACDEAKIESMAWDIESFTGMQERYPINNNEMLADMIFQLKDYKYLTAYYVWDEPFSQDFNKVKRIQDYFRANDPSKMVYSLMFPSYGMYTWSSNPNNWEGDSYKKYVDDYVDTTNPDVVSMDHYPFRNSSVNSIVENDLWRDLGYVRKKALEVNKPLWFYFQAIPLAGTNVSIITNPQLRLQTFAALTYGTVGLSYYTSRGILVDDEGDKMPRFNEVKALNREILNMGNFLFGKKSSKLYHTGVSASSLPTYFVDDLAQSTLIKTAPQDAILGVFTDSTSNEYLVVVNKDYSKGMNFDLKLKSNKEIKQFDKTINKTSTVSGASDTINLSIPAGDCAIYILGNPR